MWQRTADGCVKVLVVHRPRYDDWSLPKGKLDERETHRQAALREVREETGLVCELFEELEEARYVDRKGRPKRVRYWAMAAVDGCFEPNEEVDEVRWVSTARIDQILTYDRDAAVVAGLHVLARSS